MVAHVRRFSSTHSTNDAWTHSGHSIRRRKFHSCRTGTPFVLDLIHRLSKMLRPTGFFCVSGESELMKYGPTEDANARTIARELCRAAIRVGADFIATYAAPEVGELLKKQEV
jgi:hypothetical protein